MVHSLTAGAVGSEAFAKSSLGSTPKAFAMWGTVRVCGVRLPCRHRSTLKVETLTPMSAKAATRCAEVDHPRLFISRLRFSEKLTDITSSLWKPKLSNDTLKLPYDAQYVNALFPFSKSLRGKGLRCMVGVMVSSAQTDMERIRARLNALLDRKGHGAIGGFAERVGVSRQYLARFRKGEDVGWQTLQAIRHELESEDSPGDSPEPRETTERIVVRTCSTCGEEVPARFRGIKLLFCEIGRAHV